MVAAGIQKRRANVVAFTEAGLRRGGSSITCCRASDFRIRDSGFGFLVSRLHGCAFRGPGFGFRVSGFGFWVLSFGFRISGTNQTGPGGGPDFGVWTSQFGYWASGFSIRVLGFGFRVWHLAFPGLRNWVSKHIRIATNRFIIHSRLEKGLSQNPISSSKFHVTSPFQAFDHACPIYP